MDNHTSDIPLKRCSRGENCIHPDGSMLPATFGYFHRDASRPDGFFSYCKVCTKAHKSQWRAKNPGKLQEWRAKNPDKMREQNARRRVKQRIAVHPKPLRTKDPEHVREQKIRWRNSNPDKMREINARYAANNPDKMREKEALRRARKRGLPSAPVSEQRAIEYFGGCCAVCGRPPGLWHTLALDHWIPVTDPRPDNPGNVPTNMIPLCHSKKGSNGQGSCNLSKGNKDPYQWLVDKLGKQQTAEILARIEAYFEWITQQP